MKLFEDLAVINVGLERFSEPLKAMDIPVAQLQWQPPAAGDVKLGQALAKLTNHPEVEKANEIAFERYLTANPVLQGVGVAGEEIPGMKSKKLILHSGPPIPWEEMCGPQRGAVTGAAILEGWATNADEAEKLVKSGTIELDSCNHHNAVGPMAGAISPSMPVWIVKIPRTAV